MGPKERLETLAKMKVDAKTRAGGEAGEAWELMADASDVDVLLIDWPPTRRDVAKKLIERYGPPEQATAARLTEDLIGA